MSADMESGALHADQLEQYSIEERVLGANPLVVLGEVRNVVDDYLADGVDDMQKEVAQRCDGASKWTDEEKAVVDACFSKLLSTLRRVFDVNFDKFDAYALRNVFSVPPALFPHLDLEGVPSSVRGEPPTEEAEEALDQRLDRAHTQLQALRTVRAQVCAELQFYAKHLDPLEEKVTAVRAAWEALDGGRDGESPVQALEQAEALRPRAEERIRALAEATDQARRAAERRRQAQEEEEEEEEGGEGHARPDAASAVVSSALAGDFGTDPSALHGMAELLE